MNREDKLKLSAEPDFAYGFQMGLFVKFYEQSLWRFVHLARPLKPMPEKVKGGAFIVYGGLPIKSLEAMLAENKLSGVEQLGSGWRWPTPDDEIRPDYDQWRSAVISELKSTALAGRDVIAEILAFNLGVHTPMETMNAVLDWQEYLRNREGFLNPDGRTSILKKRERKGARL